MSDLELFEKLWAEMVEKPPGVKFEDGNWKIKVTRQELFSMLSKAHNQALEDAANVFDVSAEASRQIAKRRHDARAFEAAREFYQQAERSTQSAEIIREMKSAI